MSRACAGAGRLACSLERVPYLEIDFFISEPLHLCGLLHAHGHDLSFMVLLTLCQHFTSAHLHRPALRREDEGELRGAGDKHRRWTRVGDTSFGGKRRKALVPGFTFMALMGMLPKKRCHAVERQRGTGA